MHVIAFSTKIARHLLGHDQDDRKVKERRRKVSQGRGWDGMVEGGGGGRGDDSPSSIPFTQTVVTEDMNVCVIANLSVSESRPDILYNIL